MEKHLPNAMAALWAFGVLALLLGGSRLVRPGGRTNRPPAAAGSAPHVSARHQVLVTLAALFFLAVILLFPAVARFRRQAEQGSGWGALAALGVFIGTFTVALAWAWSKNDLSWVVDKEESEPHGSS